jgi:CRISPR-associated protein Cas6/Cse3/CasE subtype I-E
MSNFFISQIIINPKIKNVQDDILDLSCLNRRLKNAFRIYDCREKVSMLYRIDTMNDIEIRLLVQSAVRPNWDELIQENNYLLQNPIIQETGRIKIVEDLDYQFKLHASPTYLSKDKKIVRMHYDQLFTWIFEKGIQNGFYVEKDEILITQLPNRTAIKTKGIEKKKINIAVVEFVGVLHVINKNLLFNGLLNGIGRGSEFGCGLLSISS